MKQINFRKNEKITVGLILLLLCIFLAVLVPALSPWTSTEMHADIRSQGMSFSHPFGTDKFGRDLFVRVWCGVRISLCVGLASALLNGALGILYGAASGYAGKTADNILMRIADIVASVPSLLYVILIMMVLGANEVSILVGLCISGWIETARIVRGEVMRIKEREFVLASRLAGAGPLRIFLTHLLPNLCGTDCGKSYISGTAGYFYRSIFELYGSRDSGARSQSWHHDPGDQKPDLRASVSDADSDSSAVHPDTVAESDRGRTGSKNPQKKGRNVR